MADEEAQFVAFMVLLSMQKQRFVLLTSPKCRHLAVFVWMSIATITKLTTVLSLAHACRVIMDDHQLEHTF